MDIYRQLVALRCFSRQDLVDLLGSETAAHWRIHTYLSKGYIERVRRDLYVLVSFEKNEPMANCFHIATKLSPDACISHSSALAYYGLIPMRDVYVSTQKRVREFSYNHLHYRFVTYYGSFSVKKEDGVRVTSLERAFIDSILDLEKVVRLDEICHALSLKPALKADQLLDVLDWHGRKQLYQKVGFILEAYKNELELPDSFFEGCLKRISQSKTYLTLYKEGYVLNKKWSLFVPPHLNSKE